MSSNRRTAGFAGVVILVSFLCSGAIADENETVEPTQQKTILVLPFHVATEEPGYEALGEALAELLIADLSSFPEVKVVERRHLDKVLKEHELSLTGLVKKDTELKVGRLLGARLLLSGTFALVDSRLRINAHLFDISSSRLVRSREVTGKVEKWLEAEKQLARALVKDLDLKMTRLQEERIDKKPQVNLYFIRGLGYYYGNALDRAIAEFMKALLLQPDHARARYWNGICYFDDKEYEHARIEFDRFLQEFPRDDLLPKAKEMLKICTSEIQKHNSAEEDQ